MKKILSLILALTLVFSIFSMHGVSLTASAASYPSVWLNNSGLGYIGDTIPLTFTYMPAYNYEKMEVRIYNQDGKLQATSELEFNNKYSNYVSFTVTWDTTNYKAGRYKIEVIKHFYSYNRWNVAPTNHTSYLELCKPKDKKVVNNTFKGSASHYSKKQNRTVAATKKDIENSYNAWENLYVKNASTPYNIQLNEMIIGDAAKKIVEEENIFNYTTLSSGTCQWILMKFNVKNRGSSTIKFSDLISWTTAYLTDGNKATTIKTATLGDLPNYSTEIAPSETKEAWVGFLLLSSQGMPYLKLQNGAFINVNPLCAETHKYSSDTDESCNKCNAKRLVVSVCKLSKTNYTYDGKTKNPSVIVKNSKGTTLKKNTFISDFDLNGSYTGVDAFDKYEKPVQDADDL